MTYAIRDYSLDVQLDMLSASTSFDPVIKAASEMAPEWADEPLQGHKANHLERQRGKQSDRTKVVNSSLASTHPLGLSTTSIHIQDPTTQSIRNGALVWTKGQAKGASQALLNYATGSPLLPQQIAEMVSNLSLLARISLKAAAFFIEVILEAARYGAGMGLGITRRALISAVGTARALHSIGSGQEWDAKASGKAQSLLNSVKNANHAFLSILDKYTAVGIYLIHHTFTMAELFTMSSFYIVSNSIKAGLGAADESVRMIDGIFGSNETSRALSSFITLVKTEFDQDPRFAHLGKIPALTLLTKAITAFAVLQNSTYKRSAKSMKMKVIYDCTVLGEVEAKSWRSMIVGSGNFIKKQRPSEIQAPIPPRSSSNFGNPFPLQQRLDLTSSCGGSNAKMSSDSLQFAFKPDASAHSLAQSRKRSHLGNGLCLTDIGSPQSHSNIHSNAGTIPASPSSCITFPTGPTTGDTASILAELDFLVGADEEGDPLQSFTSTVSPEDLPRQLQERLEGCKDDELEQGIVLEAAPDQNRPLQTRRVIKKMEGTGKDKTVYEITTETIETTETITTIEERTRPRPKDLSARSVSVIAPKKSEGNPKNGKKKSIEASSIIERDVTSTKSGYETQSFFDGGFETMLNEEDEWCEIAKTTNTTVSRSASGSTVKTNESGQESLSRFQGQPDLIIPEAPNGKPVTKHHHRNQVNHNSEDTGTRMPVVLKTMTKKLIQKRRTIRKIEIRSDNESEGSKVRSSQRQDGRKTVSDCKSATGSSRPPQPSRESKTVPSSPQISMNGFSQIQPQLTRQISPPSARHEAILASSKVGESVGSGFQKVLKKAKNTLKGSSASSQKQQALAGNPSLFAKPGFHDDLQQHEPLITSFASDAVAIRSPNPLNVCPNPTEGGLQIPHSPYSGSKHAASPSTAVLPADPKVPKQAGAKNQGKASFTHPLGKQLPPIPPRSEASRRQAEVGHVWVEPAVLPADSTSPRATIKESKRRSRAPSITSIHSFASRTHMQSTTKGPAPIKGNSGVAHEDGAFPQAHLVVNLHKFMRYSSAAYGQNFMRILGIGSLDYFFPDTTKHHANVWAFAHHVGIPVDSILLNSYSEPQPLSSERMSPLVNYVAIDDEAKAVVLTCRGTLGLSDILTDLTCTYEDIQVAGGKVDQCYQVHSGMLASAHRLSSERGTVMQTIRTALESNPDYGLIITGHSLGGGVASLLAILLSCPSDIFREQVLQENESRGLAAPHIRHPKIFTPFVTSLDCGLAPGRAIHAYAYGVPAISSPDLSKYCKGLVTSILHGHDFVPTLSLGMVRDFKNIAQTLSEEKESDVAQEIVTKVIGLYQKRKQARNVVMGSKPSPIATTAGEGLVADYEPRPQEAPWFERRVTLEVEEMMQGRTRNRAEDADYCDPGLLVDDLDPYSYTSGGGLCENPNLPTRLPYHGNRDKPDGTCGARSSHDLEDPDADLQDWLWSLIKTIRADMCEAKLYPPGEIYCIESFPVFVMPSSVHSPNGYTNGSRSNVESTATACAEAHRVILRYCEEVEKRFSEPIFARSMLRDHIPTNSSFPEAGKSLENSQQVLIPSDTM